MKLPLLPRPLLRSSTACLALLVLLAASGCGRSAEPKNVILVTVDTLRPDMLGCYGSELGATPQIDRLAEGAIVFETARAQAPFTSPSLGALMTSQMPTENGMRDNRSQLVAETPTLAETLSRNGYTTAAFVSNWVLRRGVGFERGFDHFDDEMQSRETRRNISERIAWDTTSGVLRWLRSRPEGPFFLWIHYQDPHGPYTPPEDYWRSFEGRTGTAPRRLPFNNVAMGMGGLPSYQRLSGVRRFNEYVARYLGEIRFFDESFGEVLDWLEGSGVAEDTILAFSSDHGEGLGEHEYYFAHGEYLYEHQIHVPLLLRVPGEPAQRVSDPVALIDFYPTVLRLLDIEAPPGLRGVDLLEGRSASRAIFSETAATGIITEDRKALIWNGYKCIYSGPGRCELYNLVEDPEETRDLAEEDPNRLELFREQILRRYADLQSSATAHTALELSEEDLRQLEDLGYAGGSSE